MTYHFSVFVSYLSQYMKSRMAYRADMFVEFFSDLLFQAVNLVFILVVFGHTQQLGGWTRDEIIFIYGFFLVPYGLFTAFFNLWDFNDRYIVKGEMDRVLTRPVHSLFQIVLERMELESLFGCVTGLAVMAYAGSRLDVALLWWTPLLFLLLVVGSTLVYGGVYVALASFGFYSDSRTGIMPMMYNISNYGRYPVNIYHRVIRFILTWILPFAFVGVYPASAFLQKQSYAVYAWLTPIVGIVVFSAGLLLWNIGVKKYRGAGS